MAKILEIFEMQAALAAVIETDPLVREKTVPVIADTGRNKKDIDAGLRNRGIIVTVEQVFSGTLREQDDSQTLMDISIFVVVTSNPEVNFVDQAANLEPQKLLSSLIKTVCGYPKKPGAERWRLGVNAFELSKLDNGLYIYNIQFTKEATP